LVWRFGTVSEIKWYGSDRDWENPSTAVFVIKYSTNAANDPHLSSPHVICEYRIPLVPGIEIDFQVELYDAERKSAMIWISDLYNGSPSSYGSPLFSAESIPEFSQTFGQIILTVAVFIGIFSMR